ncbi:MAG: monovalent cation/H+ antiporter subunit D family protein [Proteobacteria bacterium]|nr:monovalent cation/H+ antiporter subunit D family protein [Pseudomonadota bacterium]MCP4919574.1 monovalent cation/H+ antiporter subunit D family protein [Pseudomonadota bacterium]
MASSLMLVAFLLPLVLVVVIQACDKVPDLRDGLTVVFATATFACVAAMVPEVAAGEVVQATLFTPFDGVPIAFSVEPLGMLFALVASGLWIPTSLYAFGYMRGHHEENQTRFFTCFALAIFAALGIAFSANLLTLFLFYEVMTFSTYPLVTHHQTAKARTAGRIYLGILVFTSVTFLLFAVLWTYVATGTLDFTPGGILAGKVDDSLVPVLLALFAFGTGKAALMPFHRWLPNAMVAPTPVSALLHAVAVVKAGVFTVLKVVVYIFGLELLQVTDASHWLKWVAAITIVVSSLIALSQDNLKARLAYSTISQLAYIVLGAALATSASVIGGGLHIAMHAMGKITLFFVAGAIMVHTHKTNVSQLDGLGRRMPFTFAAFFIGSLSIIGLPPTGGAWSKWFLALGAAGDPRDWVFVGVLMLSSLLSIGYLMPIIGRGFFLPAKADGHGHDDHAGEGIDEAPLLCTAPLVATALGCFALFVFADDLRALLEPLGAM